MKLILKSIIILLLIVSCQEESLTTRTHSSSFKSNNEKIDFLNKYIHIKSTYSKLEYDIVYYDNSTGMVAGPSDWDIKLKATIDKSDIKNWIKGCTKIDNPKLDWSTINVQTTDYQWYSNTGLITIGVNTDLNEIIYQHKTNL